MIDRISFRNGILKIKVYIEGKMRSVSIKMKKMVEEKGPKDDNFLLTSIGD